MKKSLVALAVLAASGASMAQSSVTLYGWTDVNFGSRTQESGGEYVGVVGGVDTWNSVKGQSQTAVDGGSVNGNRVGFKGTEDLGSGLKVNFTLEMGLDIDTGTSGGFSRQSWVGFSGDSWGEVRFGRTTTAYDDVSGSSNANMDSSLAPMNYVFKQNSTLPNTGVTSGGVAVEAVTFGYEARPNNGIYYATPNFNGFAAAFSYAFGEDKLNADNTSNRVGSDAGSTWAINATYASGPLALQLGYQSQKAASVTSTTTSTVSGTTVTTTTTKSGNTTGTDSVNFTRLGGSYDFGVAVAKLVFGKRDEGVYSANDYMIGVDVPFGATTLSASWASSQDNDAYRADSWKRSGYGLTAMYTLSKRTFLYGGYESDTSTSNNSLNRNLDIKHSLYQIGLNHNF